MTQAVIYTRVSSKAQLKKGDGLAGKESRCRDFATYRGYEVVKTFHEQGVTGRVQDRPAMREMLAWLRKHRKDAPVVIIDDISRLARSLEAHIKLRATIGAVGASLESPSIEFGDDSDSRLIENMLASVLQHHSQKNAEQVRHRMTARLKAGFFCFWAPTGYEYVKGAGGGKVLQRVEPTASLIAEALEGYASGRFATQAAVARFLEPHPIFSRDAQGKIHPQRIKNLLSNKLYAGYFAYKPWGIGLTRGQHPALISWETFQTIQARLTTTTSAPQQSTKLQDFPLRGHVACASCGHPMTGYWAKGRNKRYPYYECFQKGCDARRKSIKRADIETAFEALLQKLCPTGGLMAMAEEMLRDIWNIRIDTFAAHRKAQKAKLNRLEADIRKTADRLVETDSAAAAHALEVKIDKLEA